MARFERTVAEPGDRQEEHGEREREAHAYRRRGHGDAHREARTCPPASHAWSASTSRTAAAICSGSKGFTMTTSAPAGSAWSRVAGWAVRTMTGVSAKSFS